MSTRAAIARPSESGFTGVYHHWDGYPTGLGSTLYNAYRHVFAHDSERMCAYLIDEHPAGWSTINGKDWTQAPGFAPEGGSQLCATCGNPEWQHYIQNFESHGLRRPEPFEPDTYAYYDHLFERPRVTYGPECYCHGGRSETGSPVTEADASDCGCEWVYVIEGHTLTVLSSYCGPGKFEGQKMIGAFGMGDPDAIWQPVAVVDMDGPEPDWEAIENEAYGEVTA